MTMLPFLNSFGSVYSNTMAGSCSLERTARDPEVSRLLSVGASTPSSCESHVEVSLLCSTGFGGPWVCMKTLSPPVPSACCAGDSTAARALLPQGSCCHQPQGVTSDSWILGCSTSFLWSPGWSKLLLLPMPHVGIAISAVLSRDTCPYTHCGMFE